MASKQALFTESVGVTLGAWLERKGEECQMPAGNAEISIDWTIEVQFIIEKLANCQNV